MNCEKMVKADEVPLFRKKTSSWTTEYPKLTPYSTIFYKQAFWNQGFRVNSMLTRRPTLTDSKGFSKNVIQLSH
jgi:hypothetical protein